jgi:putative membrane protein
MDPYWWGHHMFGWMWIFPLAFFILCMIFVFAFLFRGPGWFGRHGDRRESARDILDRRYASGEITGEQYEEMKRRLSG